MLLSLTTCLSNLSPNQPPCCFSVLVSQVWPGLLAGEKPTKADSSQTFQTFKARQHPLPGFFFALFPVASPTRHCEAEGCGNRTSSANALFLSTRALHFARKNGIPLVPTLRVGMPAVTLRVQG